MKIVWIAHIPPQRLGLDFINFEPFMSTVHGIVIMEEKIQTKNQVKLSYERNSV